MSHKMLAACIVGLLTFGKDLQHVQAGVVPIAAEVVPVPAYDPQSFVMNTANLLKVEKGRNTTNLLEFTNFYGSFSTWAREAPEFKDMGEMEAFAKVYFPEVVHFECGRKAKGCSPFPNPEILYKTHPKEARWVFWTVKMHHTIYNTMFELEHQMSTALLSISRLDAAVVLDFMQQKNEDLFAACEAIKAAVNAVINSAVSVLRQMGGQIWGDLFEDALKQIGEDSDEYWLIKFGITFTNGMIGHGEGVAINDIVRNSRLCKKFGGEFDPDNFQRWVDMTKEFKKMSEVTELSMEDKIRQLTKGSFGENPHKGPSDMALMMNPMWATDARISDAMESPLRNFRIGMERRIMESLVTQAMIQSKTFILCSPQKDASTLCDKKHRFPYLEATRWCLEQEQGKDRTVCQAMTIKQGLEQPYLIPAVGFQNLGKSTWDFISPQDAIKRSVQNWQGRGSQPKSIFTQESGMTQEQMMSLLKTRRPSEMEIPVCYSEAGYANIKTLPANDVSVDPKRDDVKVSFPISCGSRLSNETTDFYTALGYSRDGQMWLDAKDREFQQVVLPYALQKLLLLPYDRYQALCGLQMQWPSKKFHKNRMQVGQHSLCGRLLDELKNKNAVDASYEFCTGPAARAMLKEEHSHIFHLGSGELAKVQSHRSACRRWLRKLKKEEKNEEHKKTGDFNVDVVAWEKDTLWTPEDDAAELPTREMVAGDGPVELPQAARE